MVRTQSRLHCNSREFKICSTPEWLPWLVLKRYTGFEFIASEVLKVFDDSVPFAMRMELHLDVIQFVFGLPQFGFFFSNQLLFMTKFI